MKLYMHPVSTVCRPIMLLCAEHGIALDTEVVDLMSGAHHKEPYVTLNPNRQVPLLVDGDFRLAEGSAVLKYVADRHALAAYPADAAKRAKVNEAMDWFNTGFYRDFGYNLVYPQIFPHHRRRSEEAQAGVLEWGQNHSRRWLQILNDHMIGSNACVVGNGTTIADYFGACLVTLGEIIGCDFAPYPNVQRWIGAMKRLASWNRVNEVFSGFVAASREKTFVRLA